MFQRLKTLALVGAGIMFALKPDIGTGFVLILVGLLFLVDG